jgi:hypothetical protein
MSGNNQNAYAKPSRMLLGVGDLYIDDVFVGNLKGAVNLTVTRGYAYQRPGNNIADIKGEVTSEEVMMTAEICDLKVDQLRRAFGIDQAVISESKTIRKRQILKLSGVAPTSLTESAIYGTVKVSSMDRETSYVSGTDYRLSGSPFDIGRVALGSITDGQYVAVEYDFSDAGAKAVLFGGETKTPNTFRIDYTHLDSDGKTWQITFYKAMVNTDFAMAFNERESGDYTIHNISFKALVDTTKPEGQNLYEIIQEDGAV